MFGFLQWPTILTLAMFPSWSSCYWRLAKLEERRAVPAFGDAYRDYMKQAPGFFLISARWPIAGGSGIARAASANGWPLVHLDRAASRSFPCDKEQSVCSPGSTS